MAEGSAAAQPDRGTSLPPATVEETAWDILLALHSDRRCELGLDKLATSGQRVPAGLRSLAGAARTAGSLITWAMHGAHDELRAVLTSAGRELLDRYWSATSGLQVGAFLATTGGLET